MQWIVGSVFVTPVDDDQRQLKGVITWRGGATTPVEIVRSFPRRRVWDERELEVMRSWYHIAQWKDLQVLLPGRTREAMAMQARRIGLSERARHRIYWQSISDHEKARLAPRIVHTSSALVSERLIDSKLPSRTLVDLVAQWDT